MDTTEREQMLALLERGPSSLVAVLADITEEEAQRIPQPGRWSILGSVEHIAISEDYLFSQILKAALVDEPFLRGSREARMLAHGTDRSHPIESPPQGHPHGAFPLLTEAVSHFLASRERTIDFVRHDASDLYRRVTWHPVLKEANCHEMLISMGVHVLRHIGQIEETKAALKRSVPGIDQLPAEKQAISRPDGD